MTCLIVPGLNSSGPDHWQTLGARRFEADCDDGACRRFVRRPIVEDGVVIYAGRRSSAGSRSGVN
jgi:hypothetical protein